MTTIGFTTVTAAVTRAVTLLFPARLPASPSVRMPATGPKPEALLVLTVPLETVTPPLNVFAAFIAKMPVPVLMSLLPAFVPLITPV